MEYQISVDGLLNFKKSYILIDVRSPKEYYESRIPGAINIPIFSDDEREKIGTIYKSDTKKAFDKGIEIACNKLPFFYRSINNLRKNGEKVILYCWRGGMRSEAINVNMRLMKINSFKLEGGYKAYRNYINHNLENQIDKFEIVVLHGNTGVGKTKLLIELEKQGYPVIDLEKLANNRGSIFGQVGLGEPTSQKLFESYLFNKLAQFNSKYIIVESESSRIGRVNLPKKFVTLMKNGKHILVKADINYRIENILEEYLPNIDNNQIENLIKKNSYFIKRLGNEWVNKLFSLINQSNYKEFIRLLLEDYYDPMYYNSEKEYCYKGIINNKNTSKALVEIKKILDNEDDVNVL